MPATFQCTIVTPQQPVLDKMVTYASIPAWDGQIGLAPKRAALLAKLGDGPLRLTDAHGNSSWFFLTGGFAQMKDNRLTLLTEQVVAANQIDREQAQAAFKEAAARKAVGNEQVAQRDRDLNRARGMLRLAAATTA